VTDGKTQGRTDLLAAIEWTDTQGDGAGYDIHSKDSDGSDLFIEVKAHACRRCHGQLQLVLPAASEPEGGRKKVCQREWVAKIYSRCGKLPTMSFSCHFWWGQGVESNYRHVLLGKRLGVLQH
jgi:hypothetical protein